jgi:hypothetical protein
MKLSWVSCHQASLDHAEFISSGWLLRRRIWTWSQLSTQLRKEVENPAHTVISTCLLSKMWCGKWSYPGRHVMKPHWTMQNSFPGGVCWEGGVELDLSSAHNSEKKLKIRHKMSYPLVSLAICDVVSEVILGVISWSLIGPCRIHFQELVVEQEELNLISAQQSRKRGSWKSDTKCRIRLSP